MQKKNQSNAWIVKRLKHDNQKYYELQNKKNEAIIKSLTTIEKNMKEIAKDVQSLQEDINQMQELVKILAANQLIDQI